MTTGDWAFILVLAVVVVAAVVCGIAWKVAFEDGREAGALHERNLRNERRLRNRTDRATGELWGTEPDQFDDWLRNITTAGDSERLARTGELRELSGGRRATPGRTTPAGQPRPGNPAARAGTHTGSFRTVVAAKADAFIRRIQVEEEAFRERLTS
jgi:hypothetical protein